MFRSAITRRAVSCAVTRFIRPSFASSRAYTTDDRPSKARVVVVGGGIIGSSIAYHLAALGGSQWVDEGIVQLERDQLTSGTTWHAAGLMVTFGSLSETSTDMRKYSREFYARVLPEETGMETGFSPCGFIELASSADRRHEMQRIAAFNRRCGVDVHEISPREVRELFPLCEVDDLHAGFYVPTDGRVNPVDVTMAIARGAKQRGVRLLEHTAARGVERSADGRRVTGVVLDDGHVIECEYVVNAAGMWARQFGEACGVSVPLQAAEHYYALTDAIPDVDPSWPVIEDPAAHTYIRPEGGGLMVGLFEPVAGVWQPDHVPDDFSFGELEPDWERMAPFVDTAMSRVPATQSAGLKKLFCGPESFTPDLAPVVGEAPELRNYFVCAGLNSIGIISGGGMGRIVAQWVIDGLPDVDVTPFNIDRLHAYQKTPQFRATRVIEALGKVYAPHYPSLAYKTARGAKRTPFYDLHVANGAWLRSVSGFECPDWYAGRGQVAAIEKLTWNRESWFDTWHSEHEACRERAVCIDMSFMSKFLVQGAEAGSVLDWMCTARVDGERGRITYTQWLNDNGTLEGDVTVTKLDDEQFLVIVTDGMHRHAETMLRRAIEDREARATVTDVTGAIAQLNVQGPLSRRVLELLVAPGDGGESGEAWEVPASVAVSLNNENFAFRDARELNVGLATVRCTRITYVGELGYELFIPVEFAGHVGERIEKVMRAEPRFQWAGLKALASLRVEKGYRDFGHDLDNCDTLLEAGLGFTADFSKREPFRGQQHVEEQKAGGVGALRRRIVHVRVRDPEPFLFHGEVLRRNGRVVGDVRVGSYGHTVGGAVALACIERSLAEEGTKVSKKWIESGEWTVEIADRTYECDVSLAPFYDPKNERIKM